MGCVKCHDAGRAVRTKVLVGIAATPSTSLVCCMNTSHLPIQNATQLARNLNRKCETAFRFVCPERGPPPSPTALGQCVAATWAARGVNTGISAEINTHHYVQLLDAGHRRCHIQILLGRYGEEFFFLAAAAGCGWVWVAAAEFSIQRQFKQDLLHNLTI